MPHLHPPPRLGGCAPRTYPLACLTKPSIPTHHKVRMAVQCCVLQEAHSCSQCTFRSLQHNGSDTWTCKMPTQVPLRPLSPCHLLAGASTLDATCGL
jgi:hypothetical protein